MVTLADYCGGRNGARPSASFHSVTEEIGRCMSGRVESDEHLVRRGRGEGTATGERKGV